MKKQYLFPIILQILLITSCSERSYMPTYGAFVTGNNTIFKLLAPKAKKAFVVIFSSPEAIRGIEYPMAKNEKGVWTATINETGYGTLYGYRLEGPQSKIHSFYPGIIIADPYSKAAVTQNSYRHVAKSLIIKNDFDWENDSWIKLNPKDLIIYELHIRDMTAHPTSNAAHQGTYFGLTEQNQQGGIAHLKEMGFNAVQIMPIMDFANFEVPFKDKSAPVYNTWNPYARNHWGYMTTFFFAPESYYASNGTDEPGAWNGIGGKAVTEVKEMVKQFHNNGIAVIMDVVYNHVSNYDYHPLKYIDRELYFRLDKDGTYIAQSGCGNDTRSENPAMRQLILESLKYWMTEYHVDGFRFDLGYLIDAETRQIIIEELRQINPSVIILAEPWGGGYDPDEFSDMEWASFNDQFRNGIKGQNPQDGFGFIFGKWWGDNDSKSLKRFVMGSLRKYGGQYIDVSHNVNYLESHDDNTFGDFVRIGSGQIKEDEIITDRIDNSKVHGDQLALNKLGALFLFTSQGITFMHQGQEWGRSKVIAKTSVPDANIGKIDHNSYEKDNETNWLNWDEKESNQNLIDYYKGLIALRKQYSEFRHSKPVDFKFYDVGNQVAIAYSIQDKFFVAMNGEPNKTLKITLPKGSWQIIVDGESVEPEGKVTISGKLSIPRTSGVVLKRF